MLVCDCNRLTRAQVEAAIAAGAARLAEVYAGCGGSAQCGCCCRIIRDLLRAKAEASAPRA